MKPISIAITALTLCSALLAACGGASAPAAPADQAANANANAPVSVGQANGNGAPGQNGARGGFANRKRAPELPADNPAVVGIFIKRNGNTITLRGGGFAGFGGFGRRGQGNGNNADANLPTPTPSPPVELTVDTNTKIYSDTTKFDLAALQSDQQIQQTVLKVDSLDSLNMNERGFIQAWGDSSSGKLVATVLVYAQRPQRPPGQGQGQGGQQTSP